MQQTAKGIYVNETEECLTVLDYKHLILRPSFIALFIYYFSASTQKPTKKRKEKLPVSSWCHFLPSQQSCKEG